MDQSILKKAWIQHEIPPEALKRIPQEFRDPLLIFDSKSAGLNIATSLSNARGLPVVLSLHLNQKRSGYVIHNIATASQRNIGQLQQWMDVGLLRDVDEKRTKESQLMNGLQLPALEATPSSSGEKLLTKTAFVNQFVATQIPARKAWGESILGRGTCDARATFWPQTVDAAPPAAAPYLASRPSGFSSSTECGKVGRGRRPSRHSFLV